MPLPPITRFSALATNPSPTNNNNGLYVPRLNTAKIAAIPTATKVNGGMWYNDDANRLEARVNNTTITLAAGNGNVSGPNISVAHNIAIFADTTGHVIADSGVNITQVPNPAALLRFSNSLEATNATVNEIGNLGHIRFINDVSSIYVDTLTSVRFFPYNTQVCSVFTSEIGSLGLSTSESALLEIHSDSGALLLSRLTTAERDGLQMVSGSDGTNGMLLFNTTSGQFNGFDGTNWRTIPLIIDTGINLFIGKLAGNLTTTGTSNTGVGITSLESLTNGIDNTGVGNAALKQNTTGSSNSSFGARALGQNITGSLNSAFGTDALVNNISGSNNAAFGYQALIENITGSNNAAFGYQALPNNTTDNNVAFGFQALFYNTTGSSNSAFGTLALTNNITGNFNVACGFGALQNNTSSANSAFGYQSLQNTTNGDNSAFGYLSLQNNTTGSDNSAFGSESLTSNTTGSNNSTFGFQSLASNTTDSGNSAFGSQSLANNTTGSFNAAFGFNTGTAQGIYNNCAFFGVGADSSVNNLTNAIAIGYQASVGASNCMVLGGSGANRLSVGIGITPNAQLQLPTIHANRKIVLYQTANNDHQVYGFGTSVSTGIGIFNSQIDNTTSAFTWKAAVNSATSNELMRLTGNGFLGIGTPTPHAPLHIGNFLSARSLVLYEMADNDYQYVGLGVVTIIISAIYNLTYQVPSTLGNHVWYAGTSSSTANELMRLTGTGFLGIGVVPNAPLQFSNTLGNRKIVLVETANNDHQVFGFGVNSGILRYQIDASTSNHVWYTGASSSTSTELMRLTGGGLLYAKQSFACYSGYTVGGTNTVMSASTSTYTKLAWTSTTLQSILSNYTSSSNSFIYNGGSIFPPGLQEIKVSLCLTQNGAAGEVTTFAIFKNGVQISGARATLCVTGGSSTNFPVVLTTGAVITTSSDFFDVRAVHSVGSRTLNVTELNFSISST